MEHYVIINEYATDYETSITICGVEHTLEGAKRIFNHYRADEKELAVKHRYEIYEDDDTSFDAGEGENGDYMANHTRIYILRV